MKKYVAIIILGLLLVGLISGPAAAAPELQGGRMVVHYVGFGESLYGIAAQYGVSAQAIMRQNGIINPDMIFAGQPLVIPVRAGTYGDYAPHPGGGYGSCGTYHIVKAGETLSSIAYHYGVSLDALLGHNQLYNRDIVYVGQKICVPGYKPEPVGYPGSGPADPYYHRVVAGETLSKIAYHYGVDYWRVMQANNLKNPSLIWVGQRLLIPDYHHPAPPHPPPALPPAAPRYDDAYDDPYPSPPKPPPYDKTDVNDLPAAPDYKPSPVAAELPIADQPIEVVVNGGESWVGEAFEAFDDPDSITTLIIATDDKTKARQVRIRSGDYEVKGELGLVPEFGVDKFRFAFRYIPPGDYDVWIDDPDTPSEKVQVKVEAGKRVEVLFRKGLGFSGPTFASPDGWYLASWENPSKPGENIGGWSNILVKTPASGLWVRIESEGQGYEAKCFTGSKGPGACDLAGLRAGIYYLWIDGTDLTVKTYMDGNAYASFVFGRQPVPGDEDKVGPVSYD
jgi:LysM repeat protein